MTVSPVVFLDLRVRLRTVFSVSTTEKVVQEVLASS